MKVKVDIDTDKVIKAVEKGVRNGLEATAIETHADASVEATRSVDTGRLRASLSWRTGWDTGKSNAPVAESKSRDDDLDKPDDLTVYVGTNVEYAEIIEYGGSRRQGPQGYLRPAIDKNKPKVSGRINKYVKEALK